MSSIIGSCYFFDIFNFSDYDDDDNNVYTFFLVFFVFSLGYVLQTIFLVDIFFVVVFILLEHSPHQLIMPSENPLLALSSHDDTMVLLAISLKKFHVKKRMSLSKK